MQEHILQSILDFLPGRDLFTAVQSFAQARRMAYEFVSNIEVHRRAPAAKDLASSLLDALILGTDFSDRQFLDLIASIYAKKYIDSRASPQVPINSHWEILIARNKGDFSDIESIRDAIDDIFQKYHVPSASDDD